MRASTAAVKRPRFFYGWVIVGVSIIVDAVALGAGNGSFAIFLQPVNRALGWSRTTITGAITLQSLANLMLSPVVGTIVDRYGPRFIMCFGAAVAAGNNWPRRTCLPPLLPHGQLGDGL
jgi:MFS family permease